MRLILLFCSVCLVVFALGCNRSGQQSTNNSAGTANVSNGLEGDRTQAKALLDKGKQLYRDDQDTEAVEAFQQAVKLDPDLAEAHFRLALSYEALDKREDAESQYKKAVEAYKSISTRIPTMRKRTIISVKRTRTSVITAKRSARIVRRRG